MSDTGTRLTAEVTMGFPRFPELAYELRELIWFFALPRPAPEVCITRPANLPTPKNGGRPSAPLTVYTPFPSIMHVCHQARELVLRSWEAGNIELVHNPDVGRAVPVRPFDPSLDTLYWPAPNNLGFSGYLDGYNGINPALDAATAKQLRHLALEWGMMNNFPLRFVEYILESCPALESISVVFPHVPGKNSWIDCFSPPDGRSRLRRIGQEEARAKTVTLQYPGDMDWNAPLIPNPRGPYSVSIEEFLNSVRFNLDVYGASAMSRIVNRYNGTAWNVETKSFDGLLLVSKMFVEYRKGQRYPEIYEEVPAEFHEEPGKVLGKDVARKQQGTLQRLYSTLKRSLRTNG